MVVADAQLHYVSLVICQLDETNVQVLCRDAETNFLFAITLGVSGG
jgi:hypothetical protein